VESFTAPAQADQYKFGTLSSSATSRTSVWSLMSMASITHRGTTVLFIRLLIDYCSRASMLRQVPMPVTTITD